MLAVSHYEKDFINACRARVERLLSAYDATSAAATGKAAAAVTQLEAELFPNMVLLLDNMFLHRQRSVEGKDGNPMNEVRIYCTSLIENDGVVVADKQIKLKPDQSVLGLAVGDVITVDRAQFEQLAEAFFAAIEKAYG